MEIEVKREKNKSTLFSIRNLPSIPVVMLEVSKLLDNPLTSASELGKIINQDQGLVAKILSVANSPLYGLPRRVSTIEFAIIVLGFEHIKNIVIALSMIEAFKGKSEINFDKKAYWNHSVMVASAAKRLADELGYRKAGEAFTAGLLHDLGISVVHRYFNKEYNEICSMVKDAGMDYLEAEEKVFGLKHTEIGQFLSEKWNLPQPLAETILYHHNPSAAKENKVLTAIVHLADFMTQKLQLGTFAWDDEYRFDDGVIQILNLGSAEYLDKFIHSYTDLFTKQLSSINL